MIKLVKFNKLKEKDLDKIIDKHYSHWKQFNDKLDLTEIVNNFKNIYTNEEILPIGYACFDDDKLVGFCTLRKDNLKKHTDIFPWICSVMIFDEERHKGYGTKMIGLVSEEAKKLGYDKVYLWTDKAPDFYKKIGFTYVMQVEKNEGGFGELYYKEI